MLTTKTSNGAPLRMTAKTSNGNEGGGKVRRSFDCAQSQDDVFGLRVAVRTGNGKDVELIVEKVRAVVVSEDLRDPSPSTSSGSG